MSRDKQTEIHELAKQMSEAISTEVEQRYIEDEAKLESVLRANGWRKASEVAEEIFAEIDKLIVRRMIADSPLIDDRLITDIAELKKKYESEKDDDTH